VSFSKYGFFSEVTVHPVIQTVTPLTAKAKVMRVVKDEDNGQFIVGLSLEQVV